MWATGAGAEILEPAEVEERPKRKTVVNNSHLPVPVNAPAPRPIMPLIQTVLLTFKVRRSMRTHNRYRINNSGTTHICNRSNVLFRHGVGWCECSTHDDAVVRRRPTCPNDLCRCPSSSIRRSLRNARFDSEASIILLDSSGSTVASVLILPSPARRLAVPNIQPKSSLVGHG